VVSAEQWALGRLNSFIRALVSFKYKNKPHDTDLLPKEHPLSTKGRSMEAQNNWPELRYGHEPVGEEEEPEHTMDPKSHVVMQEDGMFGVVDINGDVVATFQEKEMAEKYAMENHDELMKENDEMSESSAHEDMEERPGHKEEEKSYHEEEDRMITTGQLSRIFDFDRSAIDEQNRTVSVIFSSETPVDRNFGVEILDHDRGSVRMDRLQKRAPVLLNHNMSDQLGVVESATIDPDRKGRAVLRFGRGRLSTEVFNDVVDGIRSQVSVGYRIHQMEKEDDEKLTYRAVSWEPFEISIVPTGADSMAIVGRSEEQNFKTEIIERTSKMETQIVQESVPQVDESKIREAVQKAELKRISEIESYGSEHNESELAREYIVDGRTVPEFQSAILEKIKNYKNPEKVHAIGLTPKETRAFSWMKLIRAMANPHDRKLQEDATFEFEASRAQADKNGIDPQGAWVPADVIYGQSYEDQKRDLTVGTNTAGGFTVQTDVLADSFIDVLRANMVFSRVGITELNGLNGKVSIPGSDAGSTAYWVAENGAVTESDQTFISRSLDGKTVGAMTDISMNLMKQSSIDVEAFVRNDIAMTLASQIELQGLTGNGTSNRPIGIYNTTGVGGTTINGANAPDWGDVVDIWNGVSSNNALRGNLAWVGGSTITANMMKAFRNGTGSDRAILDDGVGNDGEHRLMTYPYYVSENNVEAGKSLLTFGDFSSLVMGSWGNGLDLRVDPFTNSSTGATRIVGLYLVDFAIRTPKSFSCSVNP
jgi:HK97 family phage major capsid protein